MCKHASVAHCAPQGLLSTVGNLAGYINSKWMSNRWVKITPGNVQAMQTYLLRCVRHNIHSHSGVPVVSRWLRFVPWFRVACCCGSYAEQKLTGELPQPQPPVPPPATVRFAAANHLGRRLRLRNAAPALQPSP